MVIAMFFWGAAWISGKIITGLASENIIIFWRFVITFITFIPIVLFFDKSFKISLKKIPWILISAIIIVIYNRLFFEGLKTGLPGKGGIIVTTLNPLFTFLLSLVILKHKPKKWQVIALFIGLSGGIILLEVWNFSLSGIIASGNLFFILAAFTWANLTIISKNAQKEISPYIYSFYIYGVSAFINYFFTIGEDPFIIFNLGIDFWFNLILLSVFSICFSTTMYFIASNKLGPNKTSSFTFMVPITAVSLSWIILNEVPTVFTIIGGIMGLISIYIINFFNPKKKKEIMKKEITKS